MEPKPSVAIAVIKNEAPSIKKIIKKVSPGLAQQTTIKHFKQFSQPLEQQFPHLEQHSPQLVHVSEQHCPHLLHELSQQFGELSIWTVDEPAASWGRLLLG